MATVTKDFRIKSGLVVEGANATVSGSDIITEDALTGGTQTNISVTYDPQTKTVNFTAESGTDELIGGDGINYDANSKTISVDSDSSLRIVNDQLSVNAPVGYGLAANEFGLVVDANAVAGNGLTVGTFNSELAIDTDVVVTKTGTQNLSNKTISGDLLFDASGGADKGSIGVDQYSPFFDVKATDDYALRLSSLNEVRTESPTIRITADDHPDGTNYVEILANGASGSVGIGAANVGLTADNGNVVLSSSQKVYYTALGNSPVSSDEVATRGYADEAVEGIIGGDGIAYDSVTRTISVNAGSYINVDGDAVNLSAETLVNDLPGTGLTTETVVVGLPPKLAVDRTTVDTWYDPAGAAATAEQNANDYTDDAIGNISTSFDIAGDTGTDTVVVGSDTLTFVGGTGIETTVTNNTVTVDIDATVATLEGSQNLKNKTIENATVAGGLDANNNKITNLATPTDSTDAATKAYVDAVAEGLHIHASAAVATTTNIADLSDGPGTVDGVALNDTLNVYTRVLVKSQTNAAQNGIYVATKAGSGKWVYTRAADFDSPAEVDGGDFIFVTEGNLYSNTGWVQTTAGVTTIGTDPIEFTQFSGAGTYTAGTGLDLNGTEFVLDLSEVSTTDLPEGTNLYFTDQRAYDAVDGSSTINFVEVELNSIAKQVAATYTTGTGDNVVFAFPDTYRSGKFLVKLARGTHTEVSEVLVTLDTSDNIAITEYAVVGTNGSLGTISATYDGINENVQITVNTPSATTVKVVGTIIE